MEEQILEKLTQLVELQTKQIELLQTQISLLKRPVASSNSSASNSGANVPDVKAMIEEARRKALAAAGPMPSGPPIIMPGANGYSGFGA